jgi:hypothetical protein
MYHIHALRSETFETEDEADQADQATFHRLGK